MQYEEGGIMEFDRSGGAERPYCVLWIDLLVEDSWGIELEAAGYQVISLAEAEVSVERIQLVHPDLIFMASGRGGSEAYRCLRRDEQTQALPLVFVGDDPSVVEQIAGLDLGALDVLSVSLDPLLFMAKVRAWVALTRSHETRDRQQILRLHAQKMAAVTQLAAGLSHEINSPLQAVRDNLDFMKDAAGDLLDLQVKQEPLRIAAQHHGVAPDLLAAVDQAVQRADLDYLYRELPAACSQSLDGVVRVASLVRSLREMSRPAHAQPISVDINESLSAVLNIAKTRWTSGVRFEIDFDAALPSVPCFPSDLNAAILHVIENACDAIAALETDELGVVLLTTRAREGWVDLSIRDSGCGIAPAILTRIFDPFFTTKPTGEGLGQGLAVVWNVIVIQHLGRVHVKSVEPHGTCFTLSLPVLESVKSIGKDSV